MQNNKKENDFQNGISFVKEILGKTIIYVRTQIVKIIYGLFIPVTLLSQPERLPMLKISFPDEKLLSKEVESDKIRYAGVTSPGSTVTVQGKQVYVYPTGAFVGLVELNYGKNEIIFSALTPEGPASQTLIIKRKDKIVTTPSKKLVIEDVLQLPDKDVVLIAGDIISIRCKGTPGAKAYFRLPWLKKEIPLIESEADKDVHGIYTGHYVVQRIDEFNMAPIEFILRKNNREIRRKSKAKIGVLSSSIMRIGKTKEEAIFLDHPYITRPYGYTIPEGAKFVITGEYGDYYKARFSRNKYLWVKKDSVEVLPKGTTLHKTFIYATTVSSAVINNRTKIYFSINTPPVFTVEEIQISPAVELTLYNTILDTGWLTQYIGQENIKHVQFSILEEGVVKFTVFLEDEQLWGYNVYYEPKRLVFEIKHRPKLVKTKSKFLNGLTVFIDPGHGGDEKGAISSTGLEEKEVNLDISLALGRYLERAEAKVIFSRTEDIKLSWFERFKLAKKSNADLYLCIHNNSVPENVDPVTRFGASTFYNYQSGKELSKIITLKLKKIGLVPHTISPYYVYRHPYFYSPTDMIFVLVEAGFMSHPEDEMKLLDKDFRDKIGHAIYKAIVEFMK